MEKKKMKKSTKYLVIGVLVLFLSILGASVAYYLARVSGNLSGRAAGTELTINVEKLSSNANMDLIPLDNDLETLNLAAVGYQDKGACVDINGYSVCQIYHITLTNNGSVPLTVNGTVTLSGKNVPNIDCATMTNATTVAKNNSCMGGNVFVSGDTLAANDSNDYYVMVYINNLDEPQYDSGEFNGTITFTTNDGRKVKGRFTKPFNLVEHITNLYTDAEKTVVTANAEQQCIETDQWGDCTSHNVTRTIDYNYTNDVNLMNDRLGGITESLDGGNIRYYGAEPANYVDIGDKTEVATERRNWEKLEPGAFESSDACNAFVTEKNWTDDTIREQFGDLGFNTIDDLCGTETIPAGTPILWRIIGVFDGKLRVIRDESIGEYSWYTSSLEVNLGNGINEWSQADLMKLLNPGFDTNEDSICVYDNNNSYNCETSIVNNSLWWNRKSGTCYGRGRTCDFTNTGLSEEAKEYVVDQTIYLGGFDTIEVFANQAWEIERGSNVIQNPSDGITRTTTWTGKVGLPYLSDYGYATDFTKCTNALNIYSSDECKTNDWLFSNYRYWTMSPGLSYPFIVWDVYSDGSVIGHGASANCGVRPVLTLASETLVESGNGSKEHPYVLTQ